MKLIFLGSGSAFTVGQDNYHSNMLLTNGKNNLLIDCGSDIRFSIYKHGLSHLDIKAVYISHLHADHAGGLEWLAFTTKFDPAMQQKPRLYICETLVDALWEHVLAGGLGSLQEEEANLATYFNVHSVPENGSFNWQDVELTLIRTRHVFNGPVLTYSYGLFFEVNGIKCFITTDTQFCPTFYMQYYQQADIIFHDCETAAQKSGVHPHYSELVTLDPEIKAKIWLYHYNPGPLPDAKADGFRGFVKCGQSFDFKDMNTLI